MIVTVCEYLFCDNNWKWSENLNTHSHELEIVRQIVKNEYKNRCHPRIVFWKRIMNTLPFYHKSSVLVYCDCVVIRIKQKFKKKEPFIMLPNLNYLICLIKSWELSKSTNYKYFKHALNILFELLADPCGILICKFIDQYFLCTITCT